MLKISLLTFSVFLVISTDYIDDSRSGNYSAGASAVVRVQRSNGVFREDIGFGSNWGSNKADVISKAKKVMNFDFLLYHFYIKFLIKLICYAGCCNGWFEGGCY